MTQRLFASALFAGLAAGLIAALLQFTFVTPLIFEGELYETGARVHFEAAHDHGAGNAAGDGHAHAASDGASPFQRTALTFFMNLITYTGFALVLVAGFALAGRAGHAVTWRAGLVWGLAGFIAVQLAPAAGLPPELPGMPNSDVFERQYWWAATVACTVLALALIAFGRTWPLILAAVPLILAPHIYGAPHLDGYFGVAPPELAAHFTARSLAVGAAAWAALGTIAGYFWNKQAPA